MLRLGPPPNKALQLTGVQRDPHGFGILDRSAQAPSALCTRQLSALSVRPHGGVAWMVVFRCTQRLAKRFRLQLASDSPESTGVLGDWYANLLNVGPSRLVLCLSERTLLPVIVPARKAAFPDHFFGYLHVVLKHLGLPGGAIASETRASSEFTFAATRSRQLLGSLNDFAYHARFYIERGESPLHASLLLAEMPSKAIEYSAARDITQSLFAAGPSA